MTVVPGPEQGTIPATGPARARRITGEELLAMGDIGPSELNCLKNNT